MIQFEGPSHPEILKEDQKVRYLRLLVDLTLSMIARGQMSRDDAVLSIHRVRRVALALFPDKGGTFDLIYGSRFQRLLDEAYGHGYQSDLHLTC